MNDPSKSGRDSRLSRLLPDPGVVRDRLKTAIPRLRARARLARQRLSPLNDDALEKRVEGITPEYVEEGARRVTDTDIETVVEEAGAIEERFRDHGPLRRLLEDGRLLLELVRDVRVGRYKRVPTWTLSAAVFALLYVLNPFDLIPDALPVLGVLDDAAVVSACVALLEQDLYDYRRWRETAGPPKEKEGRTEYR